MDFKEAIEKAFLYRVGEDRAGSSSGLEPESEK